MLFKSDTDVDVEGSTVTPHDQQPELQSSPILPLSMQQRLAAWDDEDRHKGHEQQDCGVWLTLEEREAMEVEWQQQVDDVKEAWRIQAECEERERERQHQQEREAWQAIEHSRRERDEAEAIIHEQRRRQLEEEDRLLQQAIDEKRQQLQQIEQQIEHHSMASSGSKQVEEKYSDTEEVPHEPQELSRNTLQHQHTDGTADEIRAEVEEVVERLAALKDEEKAIRRAVRQERRQLNRDNMTLLLAIERNRQQLQQSQVQQATHTTPPPTQPTSHSAQPSSPSSHSHIPTADLQQPSGSQHSDELRTLRQQLMDERRRVEALQQRKEATEQDNQVLQTQVRRLKDDVKQAATQHKAALAQAEQQHATQLSQLQQHKTQLTHTIQRLQQHTTEAEEEVNILQAERDAHRRIDRHRLTLAASGDGAERGKENVGRVRKVVVERRVESDEDDGLDGLVDGLKGLRQTQAMLHSHLKKQPIITASPAIEATSVHVRARPLSAPRSVTGTPLQHSPIPKVRRPLVPLSPTLSTVSSIEGDVDLSCCHSDHSSHSHPFARDAVLHTGIKTSLPWQNITHTMR